MKPAMMNRVSMLALICAMPLVTLSGAAQDAPPVDDRANPYALVRNWPQLPEGRTLGAVSGVDIDRDGSSVWVAERCGGNPCADSTVAPILKFDAQGRLVAGRERLRLEESRWKQVVRAMARMMRPVRGDCVE
jgi:hypothetical protein